MNIKEQIINESIDRIIKRIKEIDNLLNANPASGIINLRMEFAKFDKKLGNRFCKEFDVELFRVAKEEKRLFALADKIEKIGTINLLNEKGDLSSELYQLESEKSLINLRKRIREE